MTFTVRIAGVDIRVDSIYDEVYKMCRDYLCDSAGELSVTITPEDIDFERRKSLREAAVEGRIPVIYPEPYLETLAVYRKIASGMLDYDAFLMHGAVIGVDGEAYLFTALSGVGKTTHILLWLENIEGSFVINGDKPILRFTGDGVYAFGTPWAGKEKYNTNTSLPLGAIVLLGRGEKNEITPVSFMRVYPMLLQQIYRPARPDDMRKTLELLKKLGERVDFYELRCNMEPEAAIVAYEGIKKGGKR